MKVADAKVWCKDEERWRLEVLIRLDQTTWTLKQVVEELQRLRKDYHISQHPGEAGGRR